MQASGSISRASRRSSYQGDSPIELQHAPQRNSDAKDHSYSRSSRRQDHGDAPGQGLNLDGRAPAEPASSWIEGRSNEQPHSEQVRSLQRGESHQSSSGRPGARGSRSSALEEVVSGHFEGTGTDDGDSAVDASSAPGMGDAHYNVPESWENLDELAASEPVLSPVEERTSGHLHLEQIRSSQRATSHNISHGRGNEPADGERQKEHRFRNYLRVSKLSTEIYTISYLIFFSLLGTLARVGTQALTTYPGAPITFGGLWANFGGSLVMGFLVQDQQLFSHDIKSSSQVQQALSKKNDEENGGAGSALHAAEAEAAKARMSAKKAIPLYIGLATGFCGSYTSFSTFISDAFLAMSNDLVTPGGPAPPQARNGGYSFMALLAVILSTVSLSLTALFLGGHLAVALENLTPSLSNPTTRKILDPLAVFLGWGSWLGAVFLAIFPPQDVWRGRIVFSLVFSPLGTLLRFYLAVYLNGKIPSFPLGTFAANVFATVTLGMAWDIAHVPIGGVVACQVLQGVENGFCGCLSTVSTWVVELTSLRRQHAYMYGGGSFAVSFAFLVAIMGGLRWTEGFNSLHCST